jgi:hypothetical protein
MHHGPSKGDGGASATTGGVPVRGRPLKGSERQRVPKGLEEAQNCSDITLQWKYPVSELFHNILNRLVAQPGNSYRRRASSLASSHHL